MLSGQLQFRYMIHTPRILYTTASRSSDCSLLAIASDLRRWTSMVVPLEFKLEDSEIPTAVGQLVKRVSHTLQQQPDRQRAFAVIITMQSIEVFLLIRLNGSAFNLQRSGTQVQIQIYCGAYSVYGHADGSKPDQILSLLTAKANPKASTISSVGSAEAVLGLTGTSLICWTNLRPQQAYYKHAEWLARPDAAQRKHTLESIPEDDAAPLKKMRSCRPAAAALAQLSPGQFVTC